MNKFKHIAYESYRHIPDRTYRSGIDLISAINTERPLVYFLFNRSKLIHELEARSAYYGKRRRGANGEVEIENIAITADDLSFISPYVEKAFRDIYDMVSHLKHGIDMAINLNANNAVLELLNMYDFAILVDQNEKDVMFVKVREDASPEDFTGYDKVFFGDLDPNEKLSDSYICIWNYDYFNESAVSAIQNAMNEYIINTVLHQWFSMVLPQDANLFYNNSQTYRTEILNRVNSQKKPVRRPYSYF